VSWIANTLLRGHIKTRHQSELLWRESDGPSVRWSSLCQAVWSDRHYTHHPGNANINSHQILCALHHGGFENPRYLLGFPADEWGVTACDQYDVRNTTEHIWPVWNGYAENPNISERTFGPLFIKPVGGEVNWDELGARDHVLAKHQLHHFSPYSPILRSLGFYPGPCAWHSTTERVSTLLQSGEGVRALMCGGPKRMQDRGSKESGCASLNDVAIGNQASTDGLDDESQWSTFPPYRYDKGSGSTVAIKFDVFGITHIDRKRIWVTAALMAVYSDDVPWHRILGAVRVRDKISLWQNASAQWNDLIRIGWLTKRITVHCRPMEWSGQFSDIGRPICTKTHWKTSRKTGCARWAFGCEKLVAR